MRFSVGYVQNGAMPRLWWTAFEWPLSFIKIDQIILLFLIAYCCHFVWILWLYAENDINYISYGMYSFTDKFNVRYELTFFFFVGKYSFCLSHCLFGKMNFVNYFMKLFKPTRSLSVISIDVQNDIVRQYRLLVIEIAIPVKFNNPGLPNHIHW